MDHSWISTSLNNSQLRCSDLLDIWWVFCGLLVATETGWVRLDAGGSKILDSHPKIPVSFMTKCRANGQRLRDMQYDLPQKRTFSPRPFTSNAAQGAKNNYRDDFALLCVWRLTKWETSTHCSDMLSFGNTNNTDQWMEDSGGTSWTQKRQLTPKVQCQTWPFSTALWIIRMLRRSPKAT